MRNLMPYALILITGPVVFSIHLCIIKNLIVGDNNLLNLPGLQQPAARFYRVPSADCNADSPDSKYYLGRLHLGIWQNAASSLICLSAPVTPLLRVGNLARLDHNSRLIEHERQHATRSPLE